MFLTDMRAEREGVTVSPLREMTGSAVFNEILLENVFVPDEMVLGDVTDGWNVTSRMRAHERAAVSSGVGTDHKATRAARAPGRLRAGRSPARGAATRRGHASVTRRVAGS